MRNSMAYGIAYAALCKATGRPIFALSSVGFHAYSGRLKSTILSTGQQKPTMSGIRTASTVRTFYKKPMGHTLSTHVVLGEGAIKRV